MQLDEHLEVLRAGPTGPEVGAFFDLDGTLVSGFTANVFFTNGVRSRHIGMGSALRTIAAVVDGNLLGGDPVRAATLAFASMAGREEDMLADLGERLFAQQIAPTIRPDARRLVRAHHELGHTVVVSSAATRYQIAPIASDLGIRHLVCTELEVVDGMLTGNVRGAMRWGQEKARGVRAFARKHGIDLRQSYGYGNGNEDVDFLASVGKPVALTPDVGLRRAATKFRWPVLDLADAPSATPVAVMRTAAALLGLNAGVLTGIAAGVAKRDRSIAVNTGVTMGVGNALRLAGVNLDVNGAERLEAARPAIVVANHQSALDPLILASLLRKDFTVVAKREARLDPRAMLGTALLDPVFIDRGNGAEARASLAAVGARIRSGTSLLIFPEGTRSLTPVLGPFRKGAFHLAAQTGVPVVPVVVHNAYEVFPKQATVIRPGTVRVTVLEPRPEWRADTLNEQVQELHGAFERVLGGLEE
jgi:putative phosphoserine phosphatase/1-acylglycerol-3-phosphate O-acyltransferase